MLKSHAHKTICCNDVKLFGDPPGIFKQDMFGICKYFMASPPFMFISFWSSPPLLIPAHIYHRPPLSPHNVCPRCPCLPPLVCSLVFSSVQLLHLSSASTLVYWLNVHSFHQYKTNILIPIPPHQPNHGPI